jgi:Carboxypeptidase regulatory-like domain
MLRSMPTQVRVQALATMAVLAGLLAVSGPISVAWDDAESGKVVMFSGRVVDLENGKPVKAASVNVVRSITGADPRSLPPWAGESTVRTDADGRFRLTFPPEQVAERRLSVILRIAHPGFVSRKSNGVALAEMIRGQAMGDKPFFESIKLEKGVEYTAQVVAPGGKPAAELLYSFENWTSGNRSNHFSDVSEGQTDADGRFRLRMPKSQALALYVAPPQPARARFPYAPYQHFYGTGQISEHPDVWVPTDFGRIVLPRGVRLSGRVVDTEGRPIAGQTIKAYPVRGRDQHSATTEADGSFSLGPLRPANYLIYGEGQDGFGGVSPDAPAPSKPIRVIQPVKVYLKEDVLPQPLVLREVPTVRVEVRFVDSQGRPAVGSPAKVWGLIPNEEGKADPFGAHTTVGVGPASEINDPEPQDTSDRIDWAVQDRPDDQGRIVFPAPKGLQSADLSTFPFDETVAYKTRLEENGPLKYWGGGRLGTLDRDRKITIVSYRAPTVLVTVRTEDGHDPGDLEVNAGFNIKGGDYGSRFIRQPDGRYRSQGLMPDHEYEISAWARNGQYVPQRLHRINLPEGGSAERTLILRKKPKPPEVGKPAPPFSVKTLDGRELSLAGLRGKTVLLHFCAPIRGLQGLPSLKRVRDRFGKDEHFVMISLSLANNPAEAESVIKANGLAWPQVILRDRGADPVVLDYAVRPPYRSFLIGPEGKLIARDLQDESLEKAVAEALGSR